MPPKPARSLAVCLADMTPEVNDLVKIRDIDGVPRAGEIGRLVEADKVQLDDGTHTFVTPDHVTVVSRHGPENATGQLWAADERSDLHLGRRDYVLSFERHGGWQGGVRIASCIEGVSESDVVFVTPSRWPGAMTLGQLVGSAFVDIDSRLCGSSYHEPTAHKLVNALCLAAARVGGGKIRVMSKPSRAYGSGHGIWTPCYDTNCLTLLCIGPRQLRLTELFGEPIVSDAQPGSAAESMHPDRFTFCADDMRSPTQPTQPIDVAVWESASSLLRAKEQEAYDTEVHVQFEDASGVRDALLSSYRFVSLQLRTPDIKDVSLLTCSHDAEGVVGGVHAQALCMTGETASASQLSLTVGHLEIWVCLYVNGALFDRCLTTCKSMEFFTIPTLPSTLNAVALIALDVHVDMSQSKALAGDAMALGVILDHLSRLPLSVIDRTFQSVLQVATWLCDPAQLMAEYRGTPLMGFFRQAHAAIATCQASNVPSVAPVQTVDDFHTVLCDTARGVGAFSLLSWDAIVVCRTFSVIGPRVYDLSFTHEGIQLFPRGEMTRQDLEADMCEVGTTVGPKVLRASMIEFGHLDDVSLQLLSLSREFIAEEGSANMIFALIQDAARKVEPFCAPLRPMRAVMGDDIISPLLSTLRVAMTLRAFCGIRCSLVTDACHHWLSIPLVTQRPAIVQLCSPRVEDVDLFDLSCHTVFPQLSRGTLAEFALSAAGRVVTWKAGIVCDVGVDRVTAWMLESRAPRELEKRDVMGVRPVRSDILACLQSLSGEIATLHDADVCATTDDGKTGNSSATYVVPRKKRGRPRKHMHLDDPSVR